MALFVDGLESAVFDMGIDLCRCYVGMTKHLLHRAEIGPMIQEPSGKAVAQHMG